MAIQFILGRSGTGKTSFCVKAVIDLLTGGGQEPLILLVPEQATYQAERAVLSDNRIGGYNRLSVLSFDRLQFLLSGRNAALTDLSRTGQQMIIHKVLRENAAALKVLRPASNHTGLSRQVAETITEMNRYLKSPDRLDELLKKIPQAGFTSAKFADIRLVMEQYLRFVKDKFLDREIRMQQCRQAIGNAKWLKDAVLWVDGFAGFTAVESEILEELLRTVKEAKIALCLDPDRIDINEPYLKDPEGLFSCTEKTYCDIFKLVKKHKWRLDRPVVLREAVRFSASEPLGHIEKSLFIPRAGKIKASDSVRIVSAPSVRGEVQFVAKEILRLVRDEGYRYRDIAVIASDIDGYEHYIRACFEDYGLPFFMDKRQSVSQYPLVQLICSALRIASEGFGRRDIFAYLKTGLTNVSDSDIETIENYCLAFGVTDKDWLENRHWEFQSTDGGFDQKHINSVRLAVRGPLAGLRDRLYPDGDINAKCTAEGFVRTLFDFLGLLGVPGMISGQIDRSIRQKDGAAAQRHRQFYASVLDMFDELTDIFGSGEIGCKDFTAVTCSAFEQLTAGFIPPGLDEVLVGSIERSRHPDLKAAFLIGAAQRYFPSPAAGAGVLSDEDRLTAKNAGFELSQTAEERLVERQYLAYIAFTRASQRLYVVYPLSDEKGSASSPSQFIQDLKEIFDGLEEIPAYSIHGHTIAGKDDFAQQLSEMARESLSEDGRSRLMGLLDAVKTDKSLAGTQQAAQAAAEYDNKAGLDGDIVDGLFGREVNCSATRLATFAACGYRYFARYILGVKQREEFRLEPIDIGNFYHRILDCLMKRLAAENKDPAAVGEDELIKILDGQIKEAVRKDPFIASFKGRRAHNAFIIDCAADALRKCVRSLLPMMQAGLFRPVMSEAAFGRADASIGEYRVRVDRRRELLMNGKIDRIDIADIEGGKAAVIFDYKRKKTAVNWSKLYHGLDMQLPIYILAVRKAGSSPCKNAAGAFYLPVETGPGEKYKAIGMFNGEFAAQLDGTAASGWSEFYNLFLSKDGEPYGHYESQGSLKPDDFEKVLKFTQKKIVGLAGKLFSGAIEASPYRLGTAVPCSSCEYKPLCRFDWLVNDYNELNTAGKQDVIDAAGGDNG